MGNLVLLLGGRIMPASVAPAPQPGQVPPPRIGTRVYLSAIIAQAIYYFILGVWPLVNYDTYQRLTGRGEVDPWQLRLIGMLLAVIGAALLAGAYRGYLTPEMVILGAGSALVLLITHLVAVAQQKASSVYIIDAAAESVFLLWWAWNVIGTRAATAVMTPPQQRV
jgi:hypothetical protein